MTLKRKVAAVVAALFVLFGLASFLVARAIILPSFLELEEQAARTAMQRVVATFERELDRLLLSCADLRGSSGSGVRAFSARSPKTRGRSPGTWRSVSWTDDRRSRINPLRDMWKVIREALTIRRNLRKGVYNSLPSPA